MSNFSTLQKAVEEQFSAMSIGSLFPESNF